MAIKSTDQITIVDVTDAYSVILTSEAYTFVGNTAGAPAGLSCSTDAVAYCGTNQCDVVNVDAAKIICPNGISANVTNSGTSTVTIKFTTTSTITEACEATIPVVVDGITVNKKFSFAVAKSGQNGQDGQDGQDGAPGKPGADGQDGQDGADAITITITSSNGTVFKNNSGSTVLTAHVFKGGVEQTVSEAGVVSGIGTVKWYEGTSTTGVAGKTKTVTAASVTNTKTITAQIE